MVPFPVSESTLLVAILAAYLLGALPLADRISRRRGVDIFSSGTGLGGASNVRRLVGKRPASLVLVGDIAKGALAVLVSRFLGTDGMWIILPAAAAIVGHWKSVFSGFRGGDGHAIFGGVVIAMIPIYGLISVAIAMVVSLNAPRVPYTYLLDIVVAYAALIALALAYDGQLSLTFGIGGLAAMVLAHTIIGHARRSRGDRFDDMLDSESLDRAGRNG